MSDATAAMQDPSVTSSPPRAGRHTPVRRGGSVREGKQREMAAHANRSQSAMDGRISAMDRREESSGMATISIALAAPAPVAVSEIPPRCETAFSEARTLVRNSSNRSRSSIAKPPIAYTMDGSAPSSEEPVMRSIFPRYNPDLSLDRQEYYPTQASPTHSPREAISRPLYSPTNQDLETRSPPVRSPLSTDQPMSGGGSKAMRWPQRAANEVPVAPKVSSNDEIRNLWKVANGWKAPSSEGRIYVMKLTAEKDAPIYTLSSATQPFYNVRLDPTSASAYVTVARWDPNQSFRGAAPPTASKELTTPKPHKSWQEVLTTTLEEESRKQPPNDGLVALLYPTAAAKVALERPSDLATVQRAEHECARLVWDADSGSHFLSHPALALPFCVTVERNPAWSRTEYTLEHIESPQHLARLTRDGTGTGWLEVDTAIAAKTDAVYLVDVAISALLLVAHTDKQFTTVEAFEPPPFLGPPDGSLISKPDGRTSRLSRLTLGSNKSSRREPTGKEAKKGTRKQRMEEFEIDVESQASEYGKLETKEKDKLPFFARAVVKVITVTLKCFVWMITIWFKAIVAVMASLLKCAGGGKL
jgi:hypothetical protein